MGTSTAPDVKSALLTLLQADATLTDVQVTYGFPGGDAEAQWVMLGDIDYPETAWGPMGQKAREERYRISCTINVRMPGSTEQEAMERAYELYAAVEDVARDNALLASVPGVNYVEVIPSRCFGFPYDRTGYEVQLDAHLQVRARI